MRLRFLFAMSCLTCLASADETTPQGTVPVLAQRQLFVDDFLIAEQSGTVLKEHYPVAQEVVLVCDAPWEGNVSGYHTLIADGDRFLLYYRGSHYDVQNKHITHLEVTCYAESLDGIHWNKPNLGIFDFNGSKENNIIWSSSMSDSNEGGASHNFTPFKDANPNCSPKAKFKAFGIQHNEGGLAAFKSPDGIHWSVVKKEPVIKDGAFDSQNLGFWDPNKKCYACYYRDFRNGIRDIKLSTSDDFIHWSPGTYLQYGNAPDEHLYTNAIQPYFRSPQFYIGFPTRFQPQTDQVEPILMTSRDGLNFHRWNEPLIPITAPKDRDGDRSNYMANGLLQVPGQVRELSVYGTEAYYKGPASRLRRFTIRTDGFVSVHADAAGEMTTKPLQIAGKTLSLNYAVQPGGSLRVEIQDKAGKPIPGFTLADSVPLTGDEIDQTVSWKGGNDVSSLSSQPIRLRFVLQNGDLYAMQFVE